MIYDKNKVVFIIFFFLTLIISYHSYIGKFPSKINNRKNYIEFNYNAKNCGRRSSYKPIQISFFDWIDPTREERLLNITLSEKSKLEHSLLSEKSKLEHSLLSEKLKSDYILNYERMFKELIELLIKVVIVLLLYGISMSYISKAGEYIQNALREYYKSKIQPKVYPFGFGIFFGWLNQLGELCLKAKSIFDWMWKHLPKGKKK